MLVFVDLSFPVLQILAVHLQCINILSARSGQVSEFSSVEQCKLLVAVQFQSSAKDDLILVA